MTLQSEPKAPSVNSASLAEIRAALKEGRFEAARLEASRLLEMNPQSVDAGSLLAEALLGMGRLAEALPLLQVLTKVRPDDANLQYFLGICFQRQKEFVHAARALTRAYQLDGRQFRIVAELANCLHRLKMKPQALQMGLNALQLMPDNASLHAFVANLYREFGLRTETESHFLRAIQLAPEQAKYRYLFGNALIGFEDYQRACEVLEQYRAMKGGGLTLLASTYLMLGDDEKARQLVRESAPVADNLEELSRLLFLLTQIEGHGLSYLEIARRFDRVLRAEAPCKPKRPVIRQAQLRVGFVSGDFRHHPVGMFIKHLVPQLKAHDIHAIAYSNSVSCDATTERLRADFKEWRDIAHLTTEQVCRLVEEDDIQVLVDLAGHTRHNRLDVFACKPAPVQVTWLGYGASTGVSTIDYLLADPVSVPEGTEGDYIEKIWRLPETRLCYAVPDITGDVVETPALRTGCITFGSYQSLRKVGAQVIASWAAVLREVPNSRFRWQCRPFADSTSRQAVVRAFASHGIDVSRLELVPATDWKSYLESHAEVDVLLDSFPFTGGTTTCDALWMGVPTLTLRGQTLIARQGASLLSAAGLEEWIAEDIHQFHSKALAFSADILALNALRLSLRDRVRESALFNAKKFARQLASAFHGMHERAREQASS